MQDTACNINENSNIEENPKQDDHNKHNKRLKKPETGSMMTTKQNAVVTQDKVITTQSGRISRKIDYLTMQYAMTLPCQNRGGCRKQLL